MPPNIQVNYSAGTAFPGMALSRTSRSLRSGTNAAGLIAEAYTIQITSVSSVAYTLVITYPDNSTDPRNFYKASGDSTAAQVAATLEASMEADPVVGSLFDISVSTDTLTLTARRKGIAYSLTMNLSTVTNTVDAADAGSMYPGRAVIRSAAGLQSSGIMLNQRIKHPVAADFTAQVRTATGASLTTADVITAIVRARGVEARASVVYASSNDATVSALASALDTKLNSVFGAGTGFTATAASGVMTVAAEVAGENFDLEVGVTAGGTGTFVNTSDPAESASNSLPYAFLGISCNEGAEVDSDGIPYFPKRSPIDYDTEADSYVSSSQSISEGDAVYIGTSASESGKFFNSVSSTRVWVPKTLLRWLADEPSSPYYNATGVALLRVTR